MKLYPKPNGSEAERGFTAEEIRRNIHTIFIDVECESCGKIQTAASAGSVTNGRCIKCGGKTN